MSVEVAVSLSVRLSICLPLCQFDWLLVFCLFLYLYNSLFVFSPSFFLSVCLDYWLPVRVLQYVSVFVHL
jgi:hypothetical protein